MESFSNPRIRFDSHKFKTSTSVIHFKIVWESTKSKRVSIRRKLSIIKKSFSVHIIHVIMFDILCRLDHFNQSIMIHLAIVLHWKIHGPRWTQKRKQHIQQYWSNEIHSLFMSSSKETAIIPRQLYSLNCHQLINRLHNYTKSLTLRGIDSFFMTITNNVHIVDSISMKSLHRDSVNIPDNNVLNVSMNNNKHYKFRVKIYLHRDIEIIQNPRHSGAGRHFFNEIYFRRMWTRARNKIYWPVITT